MELRSQMRGRLLIVGWALGALAVSAWAGERAILRNGFEMRCDHHATIDGRVRLYPGAGEDSFMEFSSREIASLEPVADLPPAKPTDETQEYTAAPSSPLRSAGSDAQLSPADLHELLTQAGGAHHLDVDLLTSLVKAESGGNTRAVSRTGARGLMQLMPGTASELGVSDSFKPEQNVRGGSAYLDALLTRYHDKLALALAAYNAGPAAVDKYHGIPPYHETRAYVARVIHEFNRRVRARETMTHSTTASAAAMAHPSSR